jgi:tripartite-type tricarboxylate transporter receptor subunit TctC
VPTTAEAGFPGIAGDNWQGVMVPAGTPREVIGFLHHEIVAILGLADVKERLAALGFEPVASTPAEFTRQARSEFDAWAQVIRASGIKAQ